MKSQIEDNLTHILNNNYIITNSDEEILSKLLFNIAKINIISFDFEFNLKSPLINLLSNNKINSLIVIKRRKEKSTLNNLLISNKFNKSIIENLKDTTVFVNINMQANYSNIDVENIMKSIINLKKLCDLNNITLGIKYENKVLLGNIIHNNANKHYNDFITSLKAMLYNNPKEQYEFIYDTVCDYLDNEFIKNNYCDFKNDQCIANRLNRNKYKDMGCCRSFDYGLVDITNVQLCKYLNPSSTCSVKCLAKNIACKLHTCKYLKEKNISFSIRNILLIRCFFNLKQQKILKFNHFKTKEQIISKLLEPNKKPFVLFYYDHDYWIR